MRQLVAKVGGVIASLVLLGGLALSSVSGWILDRDFYKGIAGNPAVYEAAGEHVYADMARAIAGTSSEFPLDREALEAALKDALPPDIIASAASESVDVFFDGFLGTLSGDKRIDMGPVLRRVAEERRDALIMAYARTAAPKTGIPEAALEDAAGKALDASLESMDAVIVIPAPRGRNGSPSIGAPPTPEALGSASLSMILGSSAALFAFAVIGRKSWIDRLVWLGGKLILPGAIILAIGGVGWIVSGTEISRQAIASIEPLAANGALVRLGQEALRTATQGFFWAGLITVSAGGALVSTRRMKLLADDRDEERLLEN
jgi:hypothetical protein